MNVSKRGAFYFISHITGPQHNALLISFLQDGDVDVPLPTIDALEAIGNDKHAPLDPEAIRREALEGVSEANEQFGVHYRVKQAKYYENDTPRKSIYRYLAFKLVGYLAHNVNS
jgi:hypothetical protein